MPHNGSVKKNLTVDRRLIATILDHVQERCKWQGPLIYIRYQGSSNASGACIEKDPIQTKRGQKGHAPSPGDGGGTPKTAT